jgi:hypothetical protein
MYHLADIYLEELDRALQVTQTVRIYWLIHYSATKSKYRLALLP